MATTKHDAPQYADGPRLPTLCGHGPFYDPPLLWHRGTTAAAVAAAINASQPGFASNTVAV